MNIEYMNYTINQLDTIDIYRALHKTADVHSFQLYMEHSPRHISF